MSVIFYSILTILAAYGVTVGLVFALLFLLYAAAPRMMARNGEPRPLFLTLNLFIWILSAATGGMLIGYLSQWQPNIVAFGLSCALFAVLLSVALDSLGKTSFNYQIFVAVCAFASALGGSILMQLFHLHLHITS